MSTDETVKQVNILQDLVIKSSIMEYKKQRMTSSMYFLGEEPASSDDESETELLVQTFLKTTPHISTSRDIGIQCELSLEPLAIINLIKNCRHQNTDSAEYAELISFCKNLCSTYNYSATNNYRSSGNKKIKDSQDIITNSKKKTNVKRKSLRRPQQNDSAENAEPSVGKNLRSTSNFATNNSPIHCKSSENKKIKDSQDIIKNSKRKTDAKKKSLGRRPQQNDSAEYASSTYNFATNNSPSHCKSSENKKIKDSQDIMKNSKRKTDVKKNSLRRRPQQNVDDEESEYDRDEDPEFEENVQDTEYEKD